MAKGRVDLDKVAGGVAYETALPDGQTKSTVVLRVGPDGKVNREDVNRVLFIYQQGDEPTISSPYAGSGMLYDSESGTLHINPANAAK